jgi:hypothetical protein
MIPEQTRLNFAATVSSSSPPEKADAKNAPENVTNAFLEHRQIVNREQNRRLFLQVLDLVKHLRDV